ncbi:hypothetical protein [Thiosulfativibrio zosterae]|uniref:Uncharacterized protein n=1 Tax=Thiosulfativibrio zosterae TaxID=2675053 RepID=A0A6F8PNF3_9GAMM|nr:hypothetical protein [Thiosulfativibrio zosterae]BBP43520.1 hypothetical protein THMIRHAT_12660 [Thiosulfativibrio zosterae]
MIELTTDLTPLNPIEKTKLKSQHAELIKGWQNGVVEFDTDSFRIATLLLKHRLLPDNVLPYYAKQIILALDESQKNQQLLAAFFQKPNTQMNTAINNDTIAQAVQQLMDSGLPKQEAIQKVSVRFKTSAFNVMKQYKSLFENTKPDS